MLGHGWEFQWERVNRRLKEVQAVYAGAPGGTAIALDKAPQTWVCNGADRGGVTPAGRHPSGPSRRALHLPLRSSLGGA